MPSPQEELDRVAADVPYESLARSFLEFDRPAGDDPLELVATAAVTTTGQAATAVEPTLESFRTSVLEPAGVTSFADLADLGVDDAGLADAFGAERNRHVLLEIAAVLADRQEPTDLEALCGWAAEADAYRYDADPIGEISGVGPASFQFLRQLAGLETAKPDPALAALLEDVAAASGCDVIETDDPLRRLASCEYLALTTSYSMLEIDQVAWWLEADEGDRAAVAGS